MQTIDGNKGTITPMRNMMLKKAMKTKKGKKMSEDTESQLLRDISLKIMHSVFHKYKVMRVRMKVSYHAHIQNNTISEIWMNAILVSYRFLRNSDQLTVDKKKSLVSEFMYTDLLNSEYSDCIQMLIEFNKEKY